MGNFNASVQCCTMEVKSHAQLCWPWTWKNNAAKTILRSAVRRSYISAESSHELASSFFEYVSVSKADLLEASGCSCTCPEHPIPVGRQKSCGERWLETEAVRL